MNFDLHLGTETVGHVEPVDGKPLSCLEVGTSVREVLQGLRAAGTGAALICRSGVLVGIFTERDALPLLAAAARGDESQLDESIERHMTSEPVTVTPETTLGRAIQLMAEGGYRRLPVVDPRGRPTGLLSTAGIVHYLVQCFPNVVYTLPPAPHHSTSEREGA